MGDSNLFESEMRASRLYREGSLVTVQEELVPMIASDTSHELQSPSCHEWVRGVMSSLLQQEDSHALRVVALVHVCGVAWNLIMLPVVLVARLYASVGWWDDIIFVADYM